MIQIPAILREIASSGGSLYEKGPPSIAVLHIFPTLEVAGLPITARGPYGFGSQD